MLFHQLEVFAAAFEERNFTRAADRLFLTQPAVSQSIRKTEEELGVHLFERDKKEIRPTKEAEQLYGHVRSILDEWAEAKAELSGKGLDIRLYYYNRATQKEKNFLLAELLRELPELKIHQKAQELDSLMDNDSWEEGSPYLVSAEFVTSEKTKTFHLTDAGHCMVMREQDPLAAKEQISLSDLQDQSLFLPGRFRFSHIQESLQALKEAGVTYHVANFALASEVIPNILAFGGMAIMPDYLSDTQPGIVKRPFDDGVRIPIYLAWRGKASPGLKRILQYLKERE